MIALPGMIARAAVSSSEKEVDHDPLSGHIRRQEAYPQRTDQLIVADFGISFEPRPQSFPPGGGSRGSLLSGGQHHRRVRVGTLCASEQRGRGAHPGSTQRGCVPRIPTNPIDLIVTVAMTDRNPRRRHDHHPPLLLGPNRLRQQARYRNVPTDNGMTTPPGDAPPTYLPAQQCPQRLEHGVHRRGRGEGPRNVQPPVEGRVTDLVITQHEQLQSPV
jgi:hypothetical protein